MTKIYIRLTIVAGVILFSGLSSRSEAANLDAVVRSISAKSAEDEATVRQSISQVFQAIAVELAKGNEVGVKGFGTFYLQDRTPRKARNPRTGQPIDVPAKRYPRFRASDQLKASINKSAIGVNNEKLITAPSLTANNIPKNPAAESPAADNPEDKEATADKANETEQ